VQQTEKGLLSPKAAPIEKICQMKSDILLSLGKVHVENEGRFQALPRDA